MRVRDMCLQRPVKRLKFSTIRIAYKIYKKQILVVRNDQLRAMLFEFWPHLIPLSTLLAQVL